jgi:hypothetical protein
VVNDIFQWSVCTDLTYGKSPVDVQDSSLLITSSERRLVGKLGCGVSIEDTKHIAMFKSNFTISFYLDFSRFQQYPSLQIDESTPYITDQGNQKQDA